MDTCNCHINRDEIITFCSDVCKWCDITKVHYLLLGHAATWQYQVQNRLASLYQRLKNASWDIKCYSKTENAINVQTPWRNEFVISWRWTIWTFVTLNAQYYNSSSVNARLSYSVNTRLDELVCSASIASKDFRLALPFLACFALPSFAWLALSHLHLPDLPCLTFPCLACLDIPASLAWSCLQDPAQPCMYCLLSID